METISVIIPTFNCSKFLSRLVRTLDKQRFKDVKVIFVDDCSTDDTIETLKKELMHFTLKYVILKTPKNSGPGFARNYGMSFVDSKYFCFIDSDDFVSNNYFEELVKTIEIYDCDIVVSNAVKYWDDKKIKRIKSLDVCYNHKDDRNFLAAKLDFGPWGKIFKTSLWDNKMQFPTDIRGEDGALLPALYYKAKKIFFNFDAVYYYYQTSLSRSRNGGKNYKDILRAWEILSLRIDNNCILEYKFVVAVGYGVLMNGLKSNISSVEAKTYCNLLNDKYPNGLKNKYFNTLPFLKKLFIFFAYKKMIFLMRALVWFRG